MKRSVGLFLAVIILLVSGVGWAKVVIPPKPSGNFYVQDYAQILSEETKQKINRTGAQVAEKTKAQIVVVTVKDLGDTALEEYSLELLRQWGMGDKKLNNGLLMLVDSGGKQLRVEVGYGLEGALPDGKIGSIQDKYMMPYFKKDDYSSGVENGYLALVREVMAEYKVNMETMAKPVEAEEWSLLDIIFQVIAVVVIVALVILDFMFFEGRITMLVLSLLSKRGNGGNSGGGYGGGSGGGGGASRRW